MRPEVEYSDFPARPKSNTLTSRHALKLNTQTSRHALKGQKLLAQGNTLGKNSS
mgnify:CR=1 FL=1|jgi:hypothetical protein